MGNILSTKFKEGELVEMSNDGENWEKVFFEKHRGNDWIFPFASIEGKCFKFCRRIKEEVAEGNYAVFVVGGLAPTKKNHTLESAKKEAERLSNKENKKAYVVELIGVQSPKVVSEFTSL